MKVYDSTGAEICHLYYSNTACLGSSLDTDSGVSDSRISNFISSVHTILISRDMVRKPLLLEMSLQGTSTFIL